MSWEAISWLHRLSACLSARREVWSEPGGVVFGWIKCSPLLFPAEPLPGTPQEDCPDDTSAVSLGQLCAAFHIDVTQLSDAHVDAILIGADSGAIKDVETSEELVATSMAAWEAPAVQGAGPFYPGSVGP